MTYKAMYKCRMCGETFVDTTVENDLQATAITTMIALNGHHKFNYHTFTEKTIHNCPDGSIGYADFLGFKRED